MYEKDIIIAPISALQGGSINMLRLSGEGAVECADAFFSRDLINAPGGRFYFGHLQNKNRIIDDVIVYIFRAPHSFTGEDVVEISCHGNFFITEEILNTFIDAGCRLAEPGEFSRRAFLNSKMDLLQAEAVADLIAAKNKSAVKNSLKQLHGGLSHSIQSIKEKLIHLASMVELDIDFSEEEIDIIPYDEIRKEIEVLTDDLKRLINTYQTGKNFTSSSEVLLLGKPNVGKSSLMNALINRERVIVSGQPGTTRDHIHEDILIHDHLVRLIDSAGIRRKAEAIEKAGVKRSVQLIEDAVLILLVVDLSQPADSDDSIVFEQLKKHHHKIRIIGNKKDLSVHPDMLSTLEKYFTGIPVIQVSAREKENIDVIHDTIGAYLRTHTEDHEHIITNARHHRLLKQCVTQLEQTREAVEQQLGPEFLSVDFRTAINYLAELTGDVTTDDILNHIFSNFCIGK